LAVQYRSSHLCRDRVYGRTKRSSLLLAFTKVLQLSYTWLTTESSVRRTFFRLGTQTSISQVRQEAL
jgi:hypothetical protein